MAYLVMWDSIGGGSGDRLVPAGAQVRVGSSVTVTSTAQPRSQAKFNYS